MKTPLDDNLKKIYEAFSRDHDRLRETLMASLPDRLPAKTIHIRKFIGDTIIKSRITKLAAVAVIIIAVLISMHYFGGSIDTTSATWGNVLEYVEQVSTVVFRITVISTVPGKDKPVEGQAVVYVSSEYGTRSDQYIDNKIVSITYMVRGEDVVTTVIPEEKRYLRVVLAPDKAKQMNEKNDPRLMLKELMSVKYRELGPTQIDGIHVEGIEAQSPRIAGGMFEDATARLWVDVQTELPMCMEIEGVAGSGSIQMKMVMDEFQWDVELEPSLFDPNIPDDYTSKEMEMPEVSEGTAVRGLRAFAGLTHGRYPSSLAAMTLMKETFEALKAKHGDQLTKEIKEEKGTSALQSILPAGALYAQLARENKDVAYYGDTVTAEDADAVLMRWQISDDRYRVIFGNLTTENVSAERLAELEKVQREEQIR
jgi:hypothetical protein